MHWYDSVSDNVIFAYFFGVDCQDGVGGQVELDSFRNTGKKVPTWNIEESKVLASSK